MGPPHCIKAMLKTISKHHTQVELEVLLVRRVLHNFKMTALITCGSHFGVKPLGKLCVLEVLCCCFFNHQAHTHCLNGLQEQCS